MFAAALLASIAAVAVRAAPVSLLTVEAALSLPNTTQVNQAVYYYQNGNAGACGWYSNDTDVVVGLPNEFYSNLGAVSPYCGSYVVVQNDVNNQTITALVADASSNNQTLSLSMASWKGLNGSDSDLRTVSWRFANATETAAAKEARQGASSSAAAYIAPSSTSSYIRPSSTHAAPSSSSSQAPASTTQAVVRVAASSSSSSSPSSRWIAPSSSSVAPVYVEKTSTTSYAPRTTTTSYKPVYTTTTKAYVAPTTTTKAYVAPTTTTTQWVPKTTQAQNYGSSSYSGKATFFYQGGAAGSCGNYNSDSTYLVAVNAAQMNSGWCGRTVQITNNANGKTVTATVQDTCPGCSYGSLDLSVGAFNAIGEESSGVLPISWTFA
ncbi:hypothetical protein JCM10213_006357 [Rhodosporidiobolus nylandii]